MRKFFDWFDQHGLFGLSLFLLIFIPLYPKIPLLEAIPGYLVRVRLEDVLVLLVGGIWLVQLLRKKIEWRTSFHLGVGLYALVGLVSILIAVFLQQTIPTDAVHWGKSLLHYLRYLEYFSLFFFFLAGVKTKQHLQMILIGLALTLNLVFVYGVGQRYAQLPAFSTMNREYSKGQSLILNSADKLHATFGGHYDLAAWLVLVMPILLVWGLKTDSPKIKLWMTLSQLMGLWLIWESASKTALAALLVSLGLVGWHWLAQRLGYLKAGVFSVGAGMIGLAVVGTGLFLVRPHKLYQLAPFLRPTGYEEPIDVISTPLDETWSENARKYGLSMGIRLDTLWPQAINGFTVNPYTGKGYATLNKTADTVFTESDSTDNNFLRVLGETGIMGIIFFFGFLLLILKTIRKLPTDDETSIFSLGLLAASVGLIINSMIIDVFAASKVAFSYWALAGITLSAHWLSSPRAFMKQEKQRLTVFWQWLKRSWPWILAFLWVVLLIHKRPFSEYSLIQSFELAPQQAEHVVLTQCWLDHGAICWQNFDFKPGIIYSLYLLPFMLISSQPAMYYFANLVLFFTSTWLLLTIFKQLFHSNKLAGLGLATLISWPVFYNLPAKSVPTNLWLLFSLIIIWKWLKTTKYRLNLGRYIGRGLMAVLIFIIGFNLSQYQLGKIILNNFRDGYRPSNFIAIRRANRYLNNETAQVLLAEIEPVLFDLYQDGNYDHLRLSETSLAQVDQLLRSEQLDLYISNANLEKSETATQLFESYKHQYGIRLKEIDCRHNCNFYQLSTIPVVIPDQPITWNERGVVRRDNYRLLITHNQIVPNLVSSKPSRIETIKNNLLQLQPDLLITVGQQKNHYEKDFGQRFLFALSQTLNLPVVGVVDDFQDSEVPAGVARYQRFRLGQTWLMTLDSAEHHALTAQNVLLYDTLLQLEKNPETKQVLVVAPTAKWLEHHPENAYFVEDFTQQLSNLPDRNFYFVVQEPLEQQRAEAIQQLLPDNAHLVFHPASDSPQNINNSFWIELTRETIKIDPINYLENGQ